MSLVFPADFAPEFALVDPAVAAGWIEAAEGAIDRGRWICAGINPDLGAKLKASHLMKEAGLGALSPVPTGLITSESRGGKAVTRAVASGATGEHGSTVYGQAYDNLLARLARSRRRHIARPAPAC